MRSIDTHAPIFAHSFFLALDTQLLWPPVAHVILVRHSAFPCNRTSFAAAGGTRNRGLCMPNPAHLERKRDSQRRNNRHANTLSGTHERFINLIELMEFVNGRIFWSSYLHPYLGGRDIDLHHEKRLFTYCDCSHAPFRVQWAAASVPSRACPPPPLFTSCTYPLPHQSTCAPPDQLSDVPANHSITTGRR